MMYGDQLKNGAKVIQSYSSQFKSVVLAEREDSHQPFITWEINAAGDTFWGHYFEDLKTAREDFLWRIGAKEVGRC